MHTYALDERTCKTICDYTQQHQLILLHWMYNQIAILSIFSRSTAELCIYMYAQNPCFTASLWSTILTELHVQLDDVMQLYGYIEPSKTRSRYCKHAITAAVNTNYQPLLSSIFLTPTSFETPIRSFSSKHCLLHMIFLTAIYSVWSILSWWACAHILMNSNYLAFSVQLVCMHMAMFHCMQWKNFSMDDCILCG